MRSWPGAFLFLMPWWILFSTSLLVVLVIFLAYFKYSMNGYFSFTEIVFIRDELNYRSASASKLRHSYNSSRRWYFALVQLRSSLLWSECKIYRIYKTIILPVNLYGCKTWPPTWSEEHRVLERGCWEEYMDERQMKWQEAGENCIMRSFVTCTTRQT
jgi:hypothetical protein